jgi:hypothetical protein
MLERIDLWIPPVSRFDDSPYRRVMAVLRLLVAITLLLLAEGTARAQTCPYSPYIDCGNNSCCPSSDTCCDTDNAGCCRPGSVCSSTGCVLAAGTCPAGYPVDCNDGTCCPSATVCGANDVCVSGGSGTGTGTGAGTGTALCSDGQHCTGTDICCGDDQCYPAGSTCCPDAHGCNAGQTCCGASCVGEGMLCCNESPPQGCIASLQFCCGGACCGNGSTCDDNECTPPPSPKESGCSTSPTADASGSFLFLFGVIAAALGHRRAKHRGGSSAR